MIDDLNTVVSIMLKRFPELFPRVEESFGRTYDLKRNLPEPYPFFGEAIKHVLVEHLDANNRPELLRGIFDFFEEMADSSNPGIVSLLAIEILEPLVYSREQLARAWTYMGKKTRELTRDTARHHDCLQNLPLGEGTPGNGH